MTVSASALLGFGTFASTVSAETSSDLTTKQSDIKSERSEVQSNLTDAEKQITTVLYDLKDLDKKIANTSDALKANDKTIPCDWRQAPAPVHQKLHRGHQGTKL